MVAGGVFKQINNSTAWSNTRLFDLGGAAAEHCQDVPDYAVGDVGAGEASDAARQVLELRNAAIGSSKYLDAATAARLRRTNDEALETLRTAPAAKAKKVNAVHAYELAR